MTPINLVLRKPFIVAIDSGAQTGVAIYSRKMGKVLNWYTKDFFTVQEFLTASFEKDQVDVFVEIPQTMLYARNESAIRKEELTIMYHAGGNRREALLLSQAITRLGFSVTEVAPIRQAKWNSRYMEAATGSKARSNQHERDAVRLVIVYSGQKSQREK